MFKKCDKSKYFENEINKPTVPYEEVKSILKSGQTCYRPIQNLFSSQFTCKKVKIKICITLISQPVLYGCETWSVILTSNTDKEFDTIHSVHYSYNHHNYKQIHTIRLQTVHKV